MGYAGHVENMNGVVFHSFAVSMKLFNLGFCSKAVAVFTVSPNVVYNFEVELYFVCT